MPGNYDDIIRQVLTAKGAPVAAPPPVFSDEDMLMPYPTSTAKVPLDRMRDTPWEQYIPPITGNETTPPVRSREQMQDAETQRKMAEITQQQAAMARQPNFDVNAMVPLASEYNRLAATSPSVLQGRRMREQQAAVPGDADAMLQAIQRRQQLGRGE
jgi:hypothetical protein